MLSRNNGVSNDHFLEIIAQAVSESMPVPIPQATGAEVRDALARATQTLSLQRDQQAAIAEMQDQVTKRIEDFESKVTEELEQLKDTIAKCEEDMAA